MEEQIYYSQNFDKLRAYAGSRKIQSPDSIIARGIQLSTKITDKERVKDLTHKVLRGQSVAQKDNYDIFLFGIAESIEQTKSSTSSIKEYFSWIEEAQHIIRRMTDGFVTHEDIKEKNDFIEHSFQRETELLVCLALYEKSDNPLAKKRHSELMLKLCRLRQLRSALIVNTKDKADERERTPQEKAKLEYTHKLLRIMRQADEEGNYNDLSILNSMKKLGIDHANDIEFYEGYSFYTRMLDNHRLFIEMQQRDRILEYDRLLKVLHQQRFESLEKEKSQHIRRERTYDTMEEHLDDEEYEKRQIHKRHQRAFDLERFKQIQALRGRSNNC